MRAFLIVYLLLICSKSLITTHQVPDFKKQCISYNKETWLTILKLSLFLERHLFKHYEQRISPWFVKNDTSLIEFQHTLFKNTFIKYNKRKFNCGSNLLAQTRGVLSLRTKCRQAIPRCPVTHSDFMTPKYPEGTDYK